MRKLMWFSLGFGVSSALGAYFYTPWLMLLCVAGVFLGVALLFLRHKISWWKPVLAVVLGVSVGLVWYQGYCGIYLQPVMTYDGLEKDLEAEATDYSTLTDRGSTVSVRTYLDGKEYRALLYLKGECALKPGDRLKGAFRIRMTHEGLEESTYHRGSGVFILGYGLDECQIFPCEKSSLRYFPARLRQEIVTRLETLFPEDVAFFTKALLLGDRSDVDYQTNTAFKTSGISHIIAVSGLHVSILFSVVFLLMGKKRILTAMLGIPLLILFAALAGFTPSITRACIMQILMILATLINREYDPPTALSTAVLLMLLINPMVVTSASFQLSVGCMCGIFLFSEKIQNWVLHFGFWREWKGNRLKLALRQGIASGISVTVSSMFFTAPVVAGYFGTVSLVGVITNLLTLWAVSGIFYGVLAVCVLSLVWFQGAAVLAWLVSWLIRYVLTVAKVLSKVPLSAVYIRNQYMILWVALCYLLVAFFLLWKKKRPFVLLCCGIIGLCLALVCSWMEPLLDSSRITVLDVGQGQSILLQAEGKNFLIDCGGDQDTAAADIAAETLLSMGIYRLDGVIVTHYDTDHAGGVSKLLFRVPSLAVYLPRYTEDPEIQQEIIQASQGNAYYVEEDFTLSWDNSELTVYAPVSDASANESGLCVLFHGEKCDILVTGDIGIEAENKLILQKSIPELTVLLAGHHGSKYSTGAALLSETMPQYVFISVGADNTYGHPSGEVLDRLSQYGCQVYRTDQNGTIIFRR